MTATESEGFTKKPCFPRIILRSWWRQERNSSHPRLAQKGCNGRSYSTWQAQPINPTTHRDFWLHWNKYRVLKKLNSNTCIVFHLPADFSQPLKLLKYSLGFIINTVANYCHGGKLQQAVHFYSQLQKGEREKKGLRLCPSLLKSRLAVTLPQLTRGQKGEYRTAHLPRLRQRQLQSRILPSSWSGPGQQHRLSWGQDGGHQSPLAGCSSQPNLLGLQAPHTGSFLHKGPQLSQQNMKRKRVSLCPQAALHQPRNHPGLRSAHFGSVYMVLVLKPKHSHQKPQAAHRCA